MLAFKKWPFTGHLDTHLAKNLLTRISSHYNLTMAGKLDMQLNPASSKVSQGKRKNSLKY